MVLRHGLVSLALASIALATSAHADPTRSKDGTVEVDLPSGWETTALKNAPGKIQVKSVEKNAFAIVVSEAKEDLVAKTIDDYAALIIKIELGKGLLADPVLEGPQKTKLNGHEARIYTLRGTFKDVKLVYLKYFIESDQHWNHIDCWTAPSHFKTAKDDCVAISKSFRELAP